ncbi:MAG: UDP-N-acetylglucosamine 2-epimerase (non-hydrolyzing) [Chlorobiaceae bacterium]|nr:UDP-N-acetylglucosamine 2-epimerase (non-hydrolyzing) [Chlorobiaceae bacterium]MBA4309312.1 UDP-N-acetylglucosamine 2-epimerase (non-hydrolyzing) [Chlorobiaceae bacterium]
MKTLVIFGTRPEAIKLAPVIKALKSQKKIKTIVASTGQHREMLKQVLSIFKLKIDFDLDLMKPNQDLFDITINSIEKLKTVYKEIEPDLVVVQGDTTTAFISALAAFYCKIKIAHVEAGLRSYNIFSPYPEEANRRFISVVADYNFPPTKLSEENLIKEGISKKKIFVTGNTVVDALYEVKNQLSSKKVSAEIQKSLNNLLPQNFEKKKYILITLHRREKFGEEFLNVLNSLKELAHKYSDYNFIYPVHLNPNVKIPVENVLSDLKNFYLIPPQDYLNFLYLMDNSHFIISDSGGVQEECFVFNKPIIVMRDVTEREEAIKAGYAFLVGSNDKLLKKRFTEIDNNLNKKYNYFKMKNPYGDGKASERIVKIIKKDLFT